MLIKHIITVKLKNRREGAKQMYICKNNDNMKVVAKSKYMVATSASSSQPAYSVEHNLSLKFSANERRPTYEHTLTQACMHICMQGEFTA